MTPTTTDDWTATYAPMRPEGEPDPTRSGFPTEAAAWEFVFDGMCEKCRAERERAILLTEEDREWSPDSLYPPCACEWFVIPTADHRSAASFDDILDAARYETIYKRPETPE